MISALFDIYFKKLNYASTRFNVFLYTILLVFNRVHFLYAYLLHNVVPAIAKNLKFRQKKLELLANDINKGKDGVSDLLGVYDNLIFRSFQLWKSNISNLTEHGNNWFSTNVKNLNNSNFNAANKEYLKTVGEQNYRNLVVKSFVSKK